MAARRPPRPRSRPARVIVLVFFLALAREAVAQTAQEEESPQTLQEEGSLFVTVSLPHAISLELPRSWRVVAGASREPVETGAAADIDLSRMPVPDSHVLLRANATPSDQPASLSVAFLPRTGSNLRQGEEPSPDEITAYDQELRLKVENALRSQGIDLLEWKGTHPDRLNGRFALVSEYRRRSQGFPPMLEQVNALPVNGGVAVLSLAHSEQEGSLWRAVVMRIRSSFRTHETSAP
ncbi:MAG TPA: hypothetical protein VKJ47_15780 [Candidatus Binatia bacterium]|nr:hypothetical protein [Candidatus Binatia bacterium]